MRLSIAGLNDGGTQWWSLSAAVDKRSNAEPHKGTGSALQAPTKPIARFSTICNVNEQMTHTSHMSQRAVWCLNGV